MDAERLFEASLMATEAAHRVLPPGQGDRLSEWELHQEPDGGFLSQIWWEIGFDRNRRLLADVDVWLDADLNPVTVRATWREVTRPNPFDNRFKFSTPEICPGFTGTFEDW